jgi:hypothetical protein
VCAGVWDKMRKREEPGQVSLESNVSKQRDEGIRLQKCKVNPAGDETCMAETSSMLAKGKHPQ